MDRVTFVEYHLIRSDRLEGVLEAGIEFEAFPGRLRQSLDIISNAVSIKVILDIPLQEIYQAISWNPWTYLLHSDMRHLPSMATT